MIERYDTAYAPELEKSLSSKAGRARAIGGLIAATLCTFGLANVLPLSDSMIESAGSSNKSLHNISSSLALFSMIALSSFTVGFGEMWTQRFLNRLHKSFPKCFDSMPEQRLTLEVPGQYSCTKYLLDPSIALMCLLGSTPTVCQTVLLAKITNLPAKAAQGIAAASASGTLEYIGSKDCINQLRANSAWRLAMSGADQTSKIIMALYFFILDASRHEAPAPTLAWTDNFLFRSRPGSPEEPLLDDSIGSKSSFA